MVRNSTFPEGTRPLPHTGGWRSQVIHLSAAMSVCRSATVKGGAMMKTMWVPPPLLTSFLNCSASLAALDPSLSYCHNQVLFAILVSVRQWKYYCYICRHHDTEKI